jgi:hypothetical protein
VHEQRQLHAGRSDLQHDHAQVRDGLLEELGVPWLGADL